MSIIHVYEVWDVDKVATEQKAIDSNGPPNISNSVSRYWHVETSAQTVSEVTIRTAVDPSTSEAIPVSGAAHPDNPFLFAMDFEIRHLGGGIYWLVKVDYLSVGASADPLLEPPTNSWTTENWIAPIDQDRFNKAIQNAAGENYDPPITREFSDVVLTFSCNIAAYNTGFWYPFLNTVNVDTFRGFAPNTAKVASINADEKWRGTSNYFRLTVVIKFRNYFRVGQGGVLKEWGWIRVVVNQGYHRLINTGSPPGQSQLWKQIRDQEGMPIRTPALLSADGFSLVDKDSPNYRSHEIYGQSTFANMNTVAVGITG